MNHKKELESLRDKFKASKYNLLFWSGIGILFLSIAFTIIDSFGESPFLSKSSPFLLEFGAGLIIIYILHIYILKDEDDKNDKKRNEILSNTINLVDSLIVDKSKLKGYVLLKNTFIFEYTKDIKEVFAKKTIKLQATKNNLTTYSGWISWTGDKISWDCIKILRKKKSQIIEPNIKDIIKKETKKENGDISTCYECNYDIKFNQLNKGEELEISFKISLNDKDLKHKPQISIEKLNNFHKNCENTIGVKFPKNMSLSHYTASYKRKRISTGERLIEDIPLEISKSNNTCCYKIPLQENKADTKHLLSWEKIFQKLI